MSPCSPGCMCAETAMKKIKFVSYFFPRTVTKTGNNCFSYWGLDILFFQSHRATKIRFALISSNLNFSVILNLSTKMILDIHIT